MNQKFSALITCYNSWELAQVAVDSILKFHPIDCDEIIIIDDASELDERSKFDLKQIVNVFRNKNNIGYPSSVNKGFSLVKNDFVLLLDADAYLLTSIDEAFIKIKTRSDIGIIGFYLYDVNGFLTGSYEQIPNAFNIVFGQKMDSLFKKYFPRRGQILAYSCAMLVRKNAFDIIDGFDTSFDFLDADIDFSMRLLYTKYRIILDDESKIFHVGGGSPQSAAKRVYRFYTNRVKLLRKHNLYSKFSIHLFILLAKFRMILELIYLSLMINKKKINTQKIAARLKLILELK